MKKSLCLSAILCVLAFNLQAADTKTPLKSGAVKKSASGVCHDADSRFYPKLKHFTSYDSLKACLDSGGKQPLDKKK